MTHLVRIMALTVIMVIAGTLQSAAYSVKGEACDSTGVEEAYATIRIFSDTDTVKPVAVGVTDNSGKFDRKLPKAGKYRFVLSSVGKATVTIPFEVTPTAPVADLGKIVTRPNNELQEVTVVSNRPVIVHEIDRIGYDVQADEESKTVNLNEMLKKVPYVTVEEDGTIKIKGSSSFKIYKNGRPNNSFTNNAKEIFKSLPASMIKKIEVITEPGAREDAEGVGMILNIVTLENTTIKGAMGNVSLDYANTEDIPSGNLWMTAQIDKLVFSTFGGYGFSPTRSTKNRSEQWRKFEDTNNTLLSESESKSRHSYQYMGLDLSLELDTLNLITAEFFGNHSLAKSWSDDLTHMVDRDGNDLYRYRTRNVSGPSEYWYINGGLNYQRSTRRKGENITASYRISANSGDNDGNSQYHDTLNMPVPYSGIISTSKTRFIEHTGQLDWTRPTWENHVLDVGGKYVYRDNHSDSKREYVGANTDNVEFSHITQVAAMFADYRVNLKKFGFRAGARFEYSRLEAKYPNGDHADFSSEISDLVPNASISYKITPTSTIKANYAGSISRPGIYYLDPTVTETPTSTSQGNPDLSSVRRHSIGSNYSYFAGKVNLTLGLSYDFANNDIIRTSWVKDDHVYTSYANAGKNNSASINLFVQWAPTVKTSLMLNGNANYRHYKNPVAGITSSGWGGYGYFRISQKLPWRLTASLSGSYWKSGPDLYSVRRSKFFNDVYHMVSLSRSFMKEDRLSVRLTGRNIFGPNHSKSTTYDRNSPYSGESTFYGPTRRGVSISVSYRFGKLNASAKKVRSISNDDVVGGSSGSSSGSEGGSN